MSPQPTPSDVLELTGLHRWARALTVRGLPLPRILWTAVEWVRPLPGRSMVLLPDGTHLAFDPADWTTRFAYRGRYERTEVRLLPSLVGRGETVVDVGANVGYFTVRFSRLVGAEGRVVAIEPSPGCLPSLHAVLVAADARNVSVHEVAVAAAPGSALLRGHDHADHRGLGTLRPTAGAGGLVVPVETLDSLLADVDGTVALVKIDVEGLEPEVLEGGSATVARARHLLFEVSPNFGTAEACAAFVRSVSDRFAAHAVEEHGAFLQRPRLVPVDADAIARRAQQFNVLLTRHDALDRLRTT